jgi:putative transposase
VKRGRKRKLVDEVGSDRQVSIRVACAVLEFDRSAYHYNSRRSGQAALEQRIKKSAMFVSYGYRRIHVLLRREGSAVNQKTRRIYRELGCNYAIKCPSAVSGPSCGTTIGRRP